MTSQIFSAKVLSADLKPLVSWLLERQPAPVQLFRTADPQWWGGLRRQRLAPLLYARLLTAGLIESVPEAVAQFLRHDYLAALQLFLGQEREAQRLLARIGDAGINAILLKGADLRLRLYEDPVTRPMGDLDILISQDQLSLTRQTLAHLGYRLSPFLTDPRHGVRELFENELLFEPSSGEGLAVDVHWEIRAVAGFYRLPFSVLKERATPFEFQGLLVNLLAPEHAVIHLCLHLLNDSFEPTNNLATLSQIVDLTLALTNFQIDWPLFLREVSKFNCQVPIYLVLRQLENLFRHLIPSKVLEELACYRPTFSENLLLSRRLGYLNNYIAFFHHHSCRDWCKFLASKIWPDPEYLIATLGKADRRLYVQQFLKKLAGKVSI